MNNKFFFLALFSVLLMLISCGERHSKDIDIAYELSGAKPDSSLAILNGLNRSQLSKSEKARYALVYIIAQNKSGLDVDNDSLLRTAYTYYYSRTDDSLYAKSMYYTGKYYLLNDSSELAMDCLQKSVNAAEKQGDKYTQCLALEKLSLVIRATNPQNAIDVAREAERIYSTLPSPELKNVVYSKLNVSEALLLAGNMKQSEIKCREAIKLALASRDSQTISDAYQDLAPIISEKGDLNKGLLYSKKSYEFGKKTDVSRLLLAAAYLDVDSLGQVNKLLDSVKTTSPSKLYKAYYMRFISAIKSKNYNKAIQYADSSSHYIERMYEEELTAKEKYYTSLVKAQHDNGINEERAKLMSWLIIATVIIATFIVLFVLYSYRQYKIKARLKLQSEQKEREAEKKLANEELKHRDIQLTTMRNYILKKINIVQKIEELKGNKDTNVLLSPEDWEEISMFVNSVEDGFGTRLKKKYPALTDEDLRFFMLLRLGMSAKAMGMIYGISEKSIRQKLFVCKSKFGLDSEKGISLRSFIETF